MLCGSRRRYPRDNFEEVRFQDRVRRVTIAGIYKFSEAGAEGSRSQISNSYQFLIEVERASGHPIRVEGSPLFCCLTIEVPCEQAKERGQLNCLRLGYQTVLDFGETRSLATLSGSVRRSVFMPPVAYALFLSPLAFYYNKFCMGGRVIIALDCKSSVP